MKWSAHGHLALGGFSICEGLEEGVELDPSMLICDCKRRFLVKKVDVEQGNAAEASEKCQMQLAKPPD
ncbi:hypothetical protein CK203_010941 [Vitis vinifera]|uniref:Uncharacterized protein n=1 Tax=Vitis vinifera TaxID=29760 RepID=A0A438JIG7_VITVI|nr:hypothetical protein CK203_010941 [Vitis vinifera]